jgi:hypothetical protein
LLALFLHQKKKKEKDETDVNCRAKSALGATNAKRLRNPRIPWAPATSSQSSMARMWRGQCVSSCRHFLASSDLCNCEHLKTKQRRKQVGWACQSRGLISKRMLLAADSVSRSDHIQEVHFHNFIGMFLAPNCDGIPDNSFTADL